MAPTEASRLKKRETDRRCQRESRQRVRSRIAYLESLVDELRSDDVSGQIAGLLQQIATVRDERDRLARMLYNIENSIHAERVLLYGGSNAGPGPSDGAEGGTATSRRESLAEPIASPRAPVGGDTAAAKAIRSGEPLQAVPPLRQNDAPPPSTKTVPLGRHADRGDGSHAYCGCYRSQRDDHLPDLNSVAMEGYEMWQYVHNVLDAPLKLSDDVLRWEEEHCEDVPVRAVVEGWPAVVDRLGGRLPPLWRNMRRIDDVVFRRMGRVERLAALHTLYALYLSHSCPSSWKAKVPEWYRARPSQSLSKSYALSFFTWPGVRERFVFSQHAYCTNRFWYLHNNSFKVVWQYYFRDCYSMDQETGLYQISDHFRERLGDIRAWTMGPELLEKWPEFYGDIPSLVHATMPMDKLPPAGGSMTLGVRTAPPIVAKNKIQVNDFATPGENGWRAPTGVMGDVASHFLSKEEEDQEGGPNGSILAGASLDLLSNLWDVRGNDMVPEHDWLWMAENLSVDSDNASEEI